jgi:hypothetical protein
MFPCFPRMGTEEDDGVLVFLTLRPETQAIPLCTPTSFPGPVPLLPLVSLELDPASLAAVLSTGSLDAASHS